MEVQLVVVGVRQDDEGGVRKRLSGNLEVHLTEVEGLDDNRGGGGKPLNKTQCFGHHWKDAQNNSGILVFLNSHSMRLLQVRLLDSETRIIIIFINM